MPTLLVKFSDESQYNAATATITYTNPDASIWSRVLSKLQTGDNGIFHSSADTLYVGEYASQVPNVSVTFNNIRLVNNLPFDDLIRINEMLPEKYAAFKRPRGPMLESSTIDINRILNSANRKQFISFYICRKGHEGQLLPSLKQDDRVVIIDHNDILRELKVLDLGALRPLNLGAEYFRAKDKSLSAISQLMIDNNKPNNAKIIERISQGLATSQQYMFKSFNEYYNVLHNKGIYNNNNILALATGKQQENPFNHQTNTNMRLNTILYGPPGTGKTFHSITHAISIIDGESLEDLYEESITVEGRSRIKKRYDDLVASNRIVFTTFHQSLSYEDFIEGIKPVSPEQGDTFLKYEIRKGIFQDLCDEALEALEICLTDADSNEDDGLTEMGETEPVNPPPTTLPTAEAAEELPLLSEKHQIESFDNRYQNYIDHIRRSLGGSKEYYVKSKSGRSVFQIHLKDDEITVTGETINDRPQRVSKEVLQKLDENIPDLHAENMIGLIRKYASGYHSIQWAVLNDFRNYYLFGDTPGRPNPEPLKEKYTDLEAMAAASGNPDQTTCPKFVIIMDEINRGNVSQIFGELITLIEPDKRIGCAEELRITLPYSKRAFGVPANLYIIGTMNTADRSVEALDTALRRRFSFIPMMPNAEELSQNCEGVNLAVLLETVNNRLKVLKDKDHTIGHAWLWNIKSVNDLRNVFKDKIIPLLQEYFYNDYEKLGLVLGSRFVEEDSVGGQHVFANFALGNSVRNQYTSKKVLKITDHSTWDQQAFKSIYQPQVNNA